MSKATALFQAHERSRVGGHADRLAGPLPLIGSAARLPFQHRLGVLACRPDQDRELADHGRPVPERVQGAVAPARARGLHGDRGRADLPGAAGPRLGGSVGHLADARSDLRHRGIRLPRGLDRASDLGIDAAADPHPRPRSHIHRPLARALVLRGAELGQRSWLHATSPELAQQPSPRLAAEAYAEILAWIADTIGFLGRYGLAGRRSFIRVQIAKQTILPGMLLAADRHTALTLAIHEYPVPWLEPGTEALLGIVLQLGGGLSLLLGLGTRIGGLAVLVLGIATQVYYLRLDANLFLMMFGAGYALRGPGPLSLDNLLAAGSGAQPATNRGADRPSFRNDAIVLLRCLSARRASVADARPAGRGQLAPRTARRCDGTAFGVCSVGFGCCDVRRFSRLSCPSARARPRDAGRRHSGAVRGWLLGDDGAECQPLDVLDAGFGSVARARSRQDIARRGPVEPLEARTFRSWTASRRSASTDCRRS